MKNPLTILIADRNPHVRDFLKRELLAEGYSIHLAENSRDVIKWVFSQDAPDLLILDPDLPDTDPGTLINRVQERIPPLPMVIHTFLSDFSLPSEIPVGAELVEKGARSVEGLKEAVKRIRSRLSDDPALSQEPKE